MERDQEERKGGRGKHDIGRKIGKEERKGKRKI